ncbi:GH25 family lysozyme [Pedobacter aquatilis]|uniref:KGGVGR-motif variant AAA ATPase n=1 Tax=Pedobacter aquatilis TaxID=351343 RepID=UPI0025B4A15A|nr:GH25 family lysozyme [Pedobacter aquatilis]MDN3588196.1 GH25 family lysozyme [Pedobacter aquatilis]
MIVSFYSYKGGVGRTQLCANVAQYLCFQRGKKVLVWDWDFEAPGLHYFFDKKEASSNSLGTLELLEDYVKTINSLKILPKETYERDLPKVLEKDKNEDSTLSTNITSTSLRYPVRADMIPMQGSWDAPEAGLIDLMPAGNYNDNFSYRSGNFDWMEFYQTMDGASFVELLKTEMQKLGYDYILIDSRTGISDYSGICNIQLPDLNVMVIAATMQNFDGCASIIEKIKDSEYLKFKGRTAKILPVLSRVDTSGEKFSQWVTRFNEYFAHCISNLDSNLDSEFVDIVFRDIYFRDTFLPYVTAISAGENLFTQDNKSSDTEYKAPFINIARLIEDLNPDMVIKDSFGNFHTQKGEINFYEKVPQESWKNYAIDADEAGNKRMAAIAFNQVGLKEPFLDKKMAYFHKALDNDPHYQKAADNLDALHNVLSIQEHKTNKKPVRAPEIIEATALTEHEKPQASTKANTIKLVLIVTVLLITGYIIYLTGKNQAVQQIAVGTNINDTAAYTGPLLNASAYFDTIRAQGKAVGIDISNKETIYDQTKVRQYGISFMMIKATEGQNMVDSGFNTNWTILRNKKFIAGAYHYFSTKTDPILQADNFIRRVVISAGDLPPVLNLFALENTSIDEPTLANINTYLDRVNINYGMKPIIYASKNVAAQLFKADPSRYYLWLGQPNGTATRPAFPQPWLNWKFWQFSTREKFDGILSESKDKSAKTVDANQFNGTLADLKAMTFKPNAGTAALRRAISYYSGRNSLYQRLANGKILMNKDTLDAKDFSRIKFYWSVELINQCFKKLNTSQLYGKSHQELLDYLKKNKLIGPSSENHIKIGDIAFFDFEEKKGLQASAIVFNLDAKYVYCLEGSDGQGKLKISRFRRNQGDIFLSVTIKD